LSSVQMRRPSMCLPPQRDVLACVRKEERALASWRPLLCCLLRRRSGFGLSNGKNYLVAPAHSTRKITAEQSWPILHSPIRQRLPLTSKSLARAKRPGARMSTLQSSKPVLKMSANKSFKGNECAKNLHFYFNANSHSVVFSQRDRPRTFSSPTQKAPTLHKQTLTNATRL
jgi:hypothetical protein